MRKVTTEDFIKRSQIVHGSFYDYSKVEYKSMKDRVCIICPLHGEFYQEPQVHLRGCKCPKCSGKLINTTQEFIDNASKVHNNKYDYSKSIYTTAKQKVTIICSIHGEFEQTPDAHLRLQQGCPKCKFDKLSKDRTKPLDTFIKQASKIHNKYDYSKFIYINNKTSGIIICPKHGEFLQSPDNHLHGKGCPKCQESHGERIIRNYLDNHHIVYRSQVRQKIMNKIVILDFVVKYNDLYHIIEYNGIQHYNPVEKFGGKIAFEKQCLRDDLVREQCQKQSIPLYEIKYNMNDNEIIEYLDSIFLNKNEKTCN